MAYTEVKEIKGKKYYYRVISIRKKEKISKKRIYLGHGLSKEDLLKKEKTADEKLLIKTKKTNKELERIKPKIIEILKRNNIKKAGIFGSYARGEQKKNSDIDILIDTPKDKKFSLLDLVTLEIKIRKLLKKKVDMLTYDGINQYIKEGILKEEIRII